MQKDNDNRKDINNEKSNSSKAMDSQREVEQSNDQKTDQDFPGYPHYPAREDIMDQRNDVTRENIDVENLPSSKNTVGMSQKTLVGQNKEKADDSMQPGLGDDELGLQPGTEADVTSDDLEALNASDGEIGRPQNVTDDDLELGLDVPGSELDDTEEELGEEDEENNYYSLGGDRHEHQEEDPNSGPNRDND